MTPAAPLRCPSRETLLALLTGALPPERTAELAAHVEGCEPCTVEIASLASERANVRRGGQERRLVPGTKAPRRAGRPWFWAIIVAAVLLGGFLAIRSQHEPTVIELAPPGLAAPTVRFFARASGELREIKESVARLRDGDRVRLAVDAGLGLHLLVALAQPSGATTVLWPPAPAVAGERATESRRFAAGDRGFLPGDVEVTPTLPALRIFALFSAAPLRLVDVERAVRDELAKGSHSLATLPRLRIPTTHLFTLYVERKPKTQ